MSAAEHTILSADAYVQEMLRAAEGQTQRRRTEPPCLSQARRRGRRRSGTRVLHRRSRHGAREHGRHGARARAECIPAHQARRQHPDLFEEPGDRPGREDLLPDDHRRGARCRLVEGDRRAVEDRRGGLRAAVRRRLALHSDELGSAAASRRHGARHAGLCCREGMGRRRSRVHDAGEHRDSQCEQPQARLRRARNQGGGAAGAR